MIGEKTGGASEIRRISFADAYNQDFEDMDRRVPDLSKITDLIGYNPTKSLDEIIISIQIQ